MAVAQQCVPASREVCCCPAVKCVQFYALGMRSCTSARGCCCTTTNLEVYNVIHSSARNRHLCQERAGIRNFGAQRLIGTVYLWP